MPFSRSEQGFLNCIICQLEVPSMEWSQFKAPDNQDSRMPNSHLIPFECHKIYCCQPNQQSYSSMSIKPDTVFYSSHNCQVAITFWLSCFFSPQASLWTSLGWFTLWMALWSGGLIRMGSSQLCWVPMTWHRLGLSAVTLSWTFLR